MIEDKILIDGDLYFMQIMVGEAEEPITTEVKPVESVIPGVWVFNHEIFGQIVAAGPDSLMVLTHGSPVELPPKDRRDAAIDRAVDLAFEYARGLPMQGDERELALLVANELRGAREWNDSAP